MVLCLEIALMVGIFSSLKSSIVCYHSPGFLITKLVRGTGRKAGGAEIYQHSFLTKTDALLWRNVDAANEHEELA